MRKQLLARLPEHLSDKHRNAANEAFAIVDRAALKISKIKNDTRFTPEYKRKAIDEEVVGGALNEFAQLRSPLEQELTQIRGERGALAPKAPDKTDTFAEMQRAEVRAWLRSLPEDERVLKAMTDPAAREAVIHAPTVAMTGLSKEIRERLVNEATEAEHGPELERLKMREANVMAVMGALQVARMEFETDTGHRLLETRKPIEL